MLYWVYCPATRIQHRFSTQSHLGHLSIASDMYTLSRAQATGYARITKSVLHPPPGLLRCPVIDHGYLIMCALPLREDGETERVSSLKNLGNRILLASRLSKKLTMLLLCLNEVAVLLIREPLRRPCLALCSLTCHLSS
mmetsp:Transcript_23964/g.33514  ORF Transcript_23964/g.33514 Transcript_23964/m.33514 type:complete len:139 (+) Transcript_23964:138-554(+)